MNIYQVIMTPDAIDDITALGNYIADVLGAPESALRYVRAVRKEIGSLSEMPSRNRPVDEEPWHTRGIRRLLVRKSYVYYRIDETSKTVFILNVIYVGRNQLRALAGMNMD